MTQPLCTDCRYYEPRQNEMEDICTHERAKMSHVRRVKLLRCDSMRLSFCEKGKLFEPKPAQSVDGVSMPRFTNTDANWI